MEAAKTAVHDPEEGSTGKDRRRTEKEGQVASLHPNGIHRSVTEDGTKVRLYIVYTCNTFQSIIRHIFIKI